MQKEEKNMISVKLITLCDYASVSREGKISINGVFDEFRTTNLPGVLGRGFLVATLVGEKDTTYNLKIKLMHRDSGDIETIGDIESFSGINGKFNIVVELVGARFLKEGKYYFKLFNFDVELGSVSLDVIHLKQAEKEAFKAIN